jgi:hypothetical protein
MLWQQSGLNGPNVVVCGAVEILSASRAWYVSTQIFQFQGKKAISEFLHCSKSKYSAD